MRDFVLLSIAFVTLLAGRVVAQDAQRLDLEGWRYTTDSPADDWASLGFDDSAWREGEAGFGTAGTPGARVGTVWRSSDIWARRIQGLDRAPDQPALLVHHDEDVEIWIDGERVAALKGYTTEYVVVPLEGAAASRLTAGKHLVAVHCHQTGGGQYLDVHLIDAVRLFRFPPRRAFASPLITEWGEKVTAENAWREYPRPQLVRPAWTNLNGRWQFAITDREAESSGAWAGEILVPFCLESKLSGVGRLLEPEEALWYRRTFELAEWSGRWLLHFEAVDYRCRVIVNGQEVGRHVGGSLPFSFDITEAARAGENELVVRVEDETGGAQLRGKQTRTPGGIWYTQVSGIWQTVWLEPVADRSIEDLQIRTDVETGTIALEVTRRGASRPGDRVRARVLSSGRALDETEGRRVLELALEKPRLWSPGDPFLYDLEVELLDAEGRLVDRVRSYTGLREVGWIEDESGQRRFTLNGEPIFHWGPLDQGWWPESLLTPPSDAAMLFELEFLKAAGFNMLRKHIKIEPRRYYAHCDRLGLLVWQDQPSGGESPRWTRMAPNPGDAAWRLADHEQYLEELDGMIAVLDHFPSIVVWVPFNEAWGQHATLEVGRWLVERDRTRLVNVASGGNFWPVGHVADHHSYPHPGFPMEDRRFDGFIKVVGEFGGHGWPVEGHVWDPRTNNWGYGGLPESLDELEQRFRRSIEILRELETQGIAAGVYTQTTDVEGEINGLLTYDRRIQKIPAARLREITAPLLR